MRYERVLSDVTAHKVILSPTAYMNISRLGIGHYQVLLMLFIAGRVGRVEIFFLGGGRLTSFSGGTVEDKSLSTKYKKETIESQEILNLFKKSVFLFSNALFLLSLFLPSGAWLRKVWFSDGVNYSYCIETEC